MGPISRWAVRRPWWAVLAWVVVLVAIFGSAAKFAGSYNDTFNLPDTESTSAQELLEENFGSLASAASASVVFSPSSGTIQNPSAKAAVSELATEIKEIPSVESVTSPYAVPPEQATQQGLVSPNQEVGRMEVLFNVPSDQVPAADVQQLITDVKEANSGELRVGVGGQVVDFAQGEPPASEGIGVLVAIIIMLIMFGSVVAAGLPLVTALIGLASGISLVTLAANVVDIATFGPTLAAMIGLGVGIDYALFVINRYRQAVLVGATPRDAALEAVNTAGRAVVFAGTTVVIALAGLFVLRLNFMNG